MNYHDAITSPYDSGIGSNSSSYHLKGMPITATSTISSCGSNDLTSPQLVYGQTLSPSPLGCFSGHNNFDDLNHIPSQESLNDKKTAFGHIFETPNTALLPPMKSLDSACEVISTTLDHHSALQQHKRTSSCLTIKKQQTSQSLPPNFIQRFEKECRYNNITHMYLKNNLYSY